MPEGSPAEGLVITHGAGANCESPLLVAVANAFASSGMAVLRCNLPFRQRRRFGPPLPVNAQEDRNGLAKAVSELRRIVSGRVFLGGHSYGGRQASILASEAPDICSGLLLLSYPLHPPNKPAQRRTEHLPRLGTAALFVHGTKDPFGSAEELSEALDLIPAPHALSPVENAGHDLAKGKFDISQHVVAPFMTLMAR
jgi:uncharacterized protein